MNKNRYRLYSTCCFYELLNASMSCSTGSSKTSHELHDQRANDYVMVTEKVKLTKKQYEVLNIVCTIYERSISEYMREAILFIIEMMGAPIVVKLSEGFVEGFELDLLLMSVAISLHLTGPGKISIEYNILNREIFPKGKMIVDEIKQHGRG